MILLDYAALRATPVADDPFPHVVVPNFVPPAALHAVVADLPPLGKRGSFPVDRRARWARSRRSLMAELEGDALRAAIAEKFGAGPGGLAHHADAARLDHRAGRPIHCNSTAKRVTVLLYLNPAADAWSQHEGCLRLLRGPATWRTTRSRCPR